MKKFIYSVHSNCGGTFIAGDYSNDHHLLLLYLSLLQEEKKAA